MHMQPALLLLLCLALPLLLLLCLAAVAVLQPRLLRSSPPSALRKLRETTMR